MVTFLDTVIVAAVLWYAYKGWNTGMWDTTITALGLVGCLTLAVLLHEFVGAYVHAMIVAAGGDSISQAWSLAIAFSALAWGTFAFMEVKLHGQGADEAEEPDMDPLADRIGGVVAGALGGAIFVGGVLITLSMVPFLAWVKPSGDSMFLDVGKLVFQTAGHFVQDRHEGVPLPIWGEPVSAKSNARALLTSEPWFDVNGDGACTEEDAYRDVDGGGTFTKDLYYEDIDGDGQRRIGLVDKYAVGRWDFSLASDARKRTDLKTTSPARKKGDPDGGEAPVPVDEF